MLVACVRRNCRQLVSVRRNGAGGIRWRFGQGKTDARDAHVIADAAHTMPHTLRRVGTDDETLADLSVLAGYDDDLAGQPTRLTNRVRDALLHVHPALER